ncbi:MAG: hypothetical protein CMC55_08665 [Flavobacteriaceae bacterium]|nr:hypothetical protein [Flavobacteriaceae bacterium]|tara:strand:+ start:305 stop:559 length:255 start_codon:yes stop_codon:yes gene_type:complete
MKLSDVNDKCSCIVCNGVFPEHKCNFMTDGLLTVILKHLDSETIKELKEVLIYHYVCNSCYDHLAFIPVTNIKPLILRIRLGIV